ncbi:CQS_1a_G0047370.mRNA.1.CDS.1 [Saccharomyces cerevisiae]|nr:CQS_1a_G0047370.mRNA.1.CDS.1 [Saccharomyces cerevisiae]CAI7451014.1 CQS_1a_G0047370.mRNA.1.CDS.1 [Saccharomyces cerevisiae]
MGYLCPPRQSTAEYLTAITDPNGLHQIKPGFEYEVPHTADEFEQYWLDSPEHDCLQDEIQKYKHDVNPERTKKTYIESMAQEKSKGARKHSYYTISYWEQITLCTIRGFQRIYGDRSYTVINTCAAIAQAFITGSLFYQAPSSTLGAFSRYAFESMLNAEFHGRHMDCGGTLVPSGPGFENILPENQVCAFAGSRPDQSSWVLGDDYLRSQYAYEYKNTWRNFGIMWCFLIGYIVLRVLFTEYKSPVKSGGDALVVKKGAKKALQRSWSNKNDEENLNISITTQDLKEIVSSNGDSTHADFEGLESTGVFIWRNVSFTIPHSSGKRKLLEFDR